MWKWRKFVEIKEKIIKLLNLNLFKCCHHMIHPPRSKIANAMWLPHHCHVIIIWLLNVTSLATLAKCHVTCPCQLLIGWNVHVNFHMWFFFPLMWFFFMSSTLLTLWNTKNINKLKLVTIKTYGLIKAHNTDTLPKRLLDIILRNPTLSTVGVNMYNASFYGGKKKVDHFHIL